MNRFSLTPRAVWRLADIFAWTIQNFGLSQAEAYRDKLLTRCQALASGLPPHGRSCGILVKGDPDASDLFYYREDGHYIIYHQTADQLVVIDFVHKARNLEKLLRELED